MLRGLVICPDSELASSLDQSLAELNVVEVVRDLDHYPEEVELMRCVRAQAPHVLFLSTESVPNALAVVQQLERDAPGLQLIAISKTCEPQVLLDLMRAGLREFLAVPFERQAIMEALSRAEEQAQKHPTVTDATDQLYAFLPSKPGVGTSTVALNAAIALSRFPDTGVLLMDLDLTAGIIGFMLKLSTTHSVVDAAENAHQLDESNWPQLVARVGKMDVLHSGRLNPDPRLDSAQIQYLLQFARRHYQAICVDLSGNLERYSLEIMQEAKKIFMVITPEIPSLHLAREKLGLLGRMDLGDRVRVLLNRSHKRSLVSAAQIEDLLRVPVMMNFSNDYQGVHRALQAGRSVDSDSELGKQFHGLARTILDRKAPEADAKKKSRGSIFSILPGYSAMGESKKSAV